MRIKKIELTGFKSFKEKTSLFFSQGVTGIVGPNGCGKSNIVDALLWVMGDMSSKHLRGSSMSDVIFAGTESVAPLGMAEVSLVLENQGGLFPPKYFHYSEIMITRRLHRSGESEYLINKEFVRLRDIQEIFIDTGVGAKGFSIIEQESIGKMVTAKPEERRALIEEVAGITRFQIRKKESQRKLQVTEQNVLRLEDILSEKKKQIQRLERQVKKAEKYKKIKEEIKGKDLFLAYHQSVRFSKAMDEKKEVIQRMKEKEELLQGRVLKWESEEERVNLELSKKEDEVKKAQGEQKKIQDLLREKENQSRDLKLEIQKEIHKKEMNLSLIEKLEAQSRAYKKDLEKETKEKVSLEKVSRLLESSYKEKMEVFQKTQEDVAEKESFLLEKKESSNELSQKASGLQSEIQSLRAQLEEQEKRKDEAQKAFHELKLKEQELGQRLEHSLKALKEQKNLEEKTFHEIEKEVKTFEGLKKRERLEQENFNQLESKLTQTSERLEALKDLQANYEGFQEGTKFLIKEQEKRSEKNFSLLAQVIEVPLKYEMAVEAALGRNLEILLINRDSEKYKGFSGARDFLKDLLMGLKEQKKGRSSFFYLGGENVRDKDSFVFGKGKKEEEKKEGEKKGIFLSEVVKVSDHLFPDEKEFILGLLSQVVVVSSLDEAFSLKETSFNGWIVTLEGDLFTPQGTVIGGSRLGKGLLSQKNQISDLQDQKKDLLVELETQKKAYEKVSQSLEKSRLKVEALKESENRQKVLILDSIKNQEILENERQNLSQAFKKQKKDILYHEKRISNLKNSLKGLEESISGVEEEKISLDHEIESSSFELKDLKEELESYRKSVTQTQIEWAQKNQEKEEFSNRVKKLEKSILDLESEKKKAQKEKNQSERVILLKKEEFESQKKETEKVFLSVEENEKSLLALQSEFEDLSKEVKVLSKKLSEAYQKIRQFKDEYSDFSLELKELKLNLKDLEDRIQRKYDEDLSQVLNLYGSIFEGFENQDLETVKGDLEHLEEKLRSIGEVYLLAIEEQKELRESSNFLSQQLEELLSAKKELIQVIHKIDRICAERFKESFHEVSEKFSKVFPVLFGGGRAKLILVETEEEAEEKGDKKVVGIEIEAEPPGKKLKNIKLLSGGEKALTALALIFSVFLLKPSPFCILDEVDAPLDDANVFRFNALLSEMVRYSQVILVTHNKYSMKKSDFLFGVTMEKKGISKVVSVKLSEKMSGDEVLSASKEKSMQEMALKER